MHDQTILSDAQEQSEQQTSPSGSELTIENLTENRDLISQVRDAGYGRLTKFQSQVVPHFMEGKDVLAQGPKRGRSLAYGLGLALAFEKGDKNRTFVITETEGDAERIARGLSDLGVPAAKVGGKQRGGKNGVASASSLVGTTQGLLDAFDQGVIDGSRVNRAILDGVEGTIQSGRLEELLNLLHDLTQTQVIFIRNDLSVNITHFVKKFLKSPVEVIVEESADDNAQDSSAAPAEEYAPEAEESAPRAAAYQPPAAPAKQKKVAANAVHSYLELGGDLLAKPNALCDLIDGEGSPATVVFCNSPSEADLTDVMLRKRGIGSRKLIGFVPPGKITSAVAALQNHEVTALVVTDISARDIQISGVGLVVNYSVHSDPEVYLQRAAVAEEGPEALRVVSLITPLDLANFHSLKKLVSVEFSKAELPSKEQVLSRKIDLLAQKAKEKSASIDERIKSISSLIAQSPSKDEIVAYLVYNTIEALPAALANAERARAPEFAERERSDDRDDGHNRDDDRGNRRGRGRRDRDNRGGPRRDDYEGGDEQSARSQDSYDDAGQEGSDDSYNRNDEGGRSREYRGRRDRRPRRDDGEGFSDSGVPYVPPAKDLRLYVGHGKKEGVDKEKIVELLTSRCDVTADQIKRTITRDNYSFVDVPEEIAEAVVAKLGEAELPSGVKVFVRKAVSISAPREERRPSDDEGRAEGGEDAPAEGTESSVETVG